MAGEQDENIPAGGLPGGDLPSGDRPPGEPGEPLTVPGPIRAACAILGLEALALTALAAFVVLDTLISHADSVGRALFGAVLALLGAGSLAMCARGLWRLSVAARTPVVVLQLIALPVSYDLAFEAGRYAYGGPLLVAALAVLYLLFTPPARAALDREITR